MDYYEDWNVSKNVAGYDNNSQYSEIDNLVKYAIDNSASDIHIVTNRTSSLRIKEQITKSDSLIDEDSLIGFLKKHSNAAEDRIDDFVEGRKFSADFAVTFCNRRFRAHLFKSNNNICAVLRLLSESIPDLSILNLPASINKFVNAKSGLILICGATGSGKTTTIASIVNQINRSRNEAIITIEDPIEYVYEESKSIIEQREVGTHVESFSQATIDALREDPDIIVVGEMRDLETIQNGITLAETGHLVFGTLHTKSAIDAVDRMVDIFPPAQQQQIRVQLASVLYGVVHQQLIKSKYTGKVVALCEVMIVDPIVANAIRIPSKSQGSSLKDYLRNKRDIGCVDIVENAIWHIKFGRLKIDDVRYNLGEDDLRLLQARLR